MQFTRALFLKCSIVICCSFLLSACDNGSSSSERANPTRGKIVSATLERQLGLDELTQLNATANLISKYPVKVYNIIYETIDPFGEPHQASGTLAVPQTDKSMVLPVLSYHHGTMLNRFVLDDPQFQMLIPLAASAGFVALAPHFLGHEVSDIPHPYVHEESLASAGLDLHRAAENFAKQQSFEVSNQLYIMGYSEGGYAAMSLYKDIQLNHADEFSVKAAAPGAGPYDLSGTMVDVMLSEAEYSNPFYLPYLLFGYNYIYKIYESSSDYIKDESYMFVLDSLDQLTAAGMPAAHIQAIDTIRGHEFGSEQALLAAVETVIGAEALSIYHAIILEQGRHDWAKTIDQIFTGERSTIGSANRKFPARPIMIMRDEVLENFTTNENHPFRIHLKENDLTDWVPESPTRMFHCVEDEQVNIENSRLTYNIFLENGASPAISSLDERNYRKANGDAFSHAECAEPIIIESFLWFVGLANEE